MKKFKNIKTGAIVYSESLNKDFVIIATAKFNVAVERDWFESNYVEVKEQWLTSED